MPRNMPCAACGSLMWRGPASLPEGEATCHPCRRALHPIGQARYKTTCADCEAPSWGVRCRTCRDKAQTVRPDDDPHRTRRRREQAAPGLTVTQRSRLLVRWKQQARTCTYCGSPADTVDHVVPLVRGGTNYEGNLTPCCRSCNGSKSGYMVSEWRHGKRLPARTELMPWRAKPKREAKPKRWAEPEPLFNQCVCGSTVVGRGTWCSDKCYMRTQYRRRVGIPDDAPLYSHAS